MIYLDQHAEPNEIARTLWRELGPNMHRNSFDACRSRERANADSRSGGTHKANAPAEVGQDQSRGGRDVASTDESTARRQKRQLKNVWYEDGGRYLYRYGANGLTVFDVWKLIGEPLRIRGRA